MEVLDAAARHLVAAKSSAINAAKELQKLPLSMEHGLKLLRIIQDLDRIQSYLNTDDAEATAATALRAKPKKRTRLRKKQDQGHPENGAGSPAVSLPQADPQSLKVPVTPSRFTT